MNRHLLAYIVLVFSTVAISLLAAFTIIQDPDASKDIFNIILPVFSSWVGTVLAFYFGKESFESANKQVREIVEKLAPEERVRAKVSSIMRALGESVVYKIERNQSTNDVLVADLQKKYSGRCSRLPIVEFDNRPVYMIHESMVDHYIASGESVQSTLHQFLTWYANNGVRFDLNSGFVVVSGSSTIASARHRMESMRSCQDIFVTDDGTASKPVIGWISNTRLLKFVRD
ncbi:MAG: hypothetical protein AAGF01_00725 [Cyanobacteria bacterium P01_G01_bin.38]